VNVSGGSIGDYLEAYADSMVTFSGGSIGDYLGGPSKTAR
jgi:hypothetical protein